MRVKGSFTGHERTDHLLFFDFDETYYPHACTQELLEHVYELEEYLEELAREQFIKIIWVTGSGLPEVIQKMERARMTFSPHFIAGNLGTELYEVNKQGQLKSNPSWEKKIRKSGFSGQKIVELERELFHQYGIKLIEQTQFGQKKYKWNYYYFISSETKSLYDLSIIKHLAQINGIGLNINRCNPKAGDPENAFDVDFIPLGTGKSEVVRFMGNYYNVPIRRTTAFGDSGNDINMLKAVQHGYLVKNATPEAKQLHSNVTASSYAKGIIETLQLIFNFEKARE